MDDPLPAPLWIADPAALERMAQILAAQSRLAVDTESNSLHAFREQVCLIQFSTDKTDYLVDPLVLQDLSALTTFFCDTRIEKVFHAAEYDLICLRRDFRLSFANIFDTMQAARILGYKQVGLDAMLEIKLGIELDKRFQKADWGTRPLPEEMLSYARLDTHHLLTLRDSLEQELQERGRLELAHEEFARLATVTGNGKADLPSWQRVKGTQHFSKRQLAILQELCQWREAQAERMHRPIFKVIDDKRLVAIAQAGPRIEKDLEAINLTSHQISRFGKYILQAVERGRKADPIHRPLAGRPDPQVLNRLNALAGWRKSVAQKMDIESDLVLPKPWMHVIATHDPSDLQELSAYMPQSPWRLANFGEEILSVLHGKSEEVE